MRPDISSAIAAVEIASLTKRFGTATAVDALSFTAESGRVTGFLGPNGAGKSTTLRALLGLVRPTSGTATFDGRTYEQLEEPASRVGVVLEDTAFHPGRTGRDHLRVLAAAGGHPDARVDEMLVLVGLADDGGRRVKGYSLGMRQRLAIAAALLGDPSVLILDEPANGLDPPGIRWLRDLVRGQAKEGRAVLVSSHLLAEVAQVVDDVVVIAGGRLRARGTLAEVLGHEGGGAAVRSPDSDRLASLLTAQGAKISRTGPDELLVGGMPAARVGEVAAAERLVLHALGDRSRSLEDAFLELTGEPAAPPPGGPSA
ncbi:MAG: Efflux ABC transporter, ATP-binding protein [uncultured Solirubrobacteraceae bacterium]|uniref:Efflux ABC transporter, ATP-binding protein n=1 Tax=uncultured Solirubrobacteraceae bacterium TaxID=1162706 RepID=A0A6J4T0K0_9ACTN|nr:MAG: Efflux ABC transporter, ATP-binding protein [uncultured Solirubrobacteraceae bacterium]